MFLETVTDCVHAQHTDVVAMNLHLVAMPTSTLRQDLTCCVVCASGQTSSNNAAKGMHVMKRHDAHLSHSPSPNAHTHLHPGNERGLVHFSSRPCQKSRVGAPNGRGRQGSPRGGVMCSCRNFLYQAFQPARTLACHVQPLPISLA